MIQSHFSFSSITLKTKTWSKLVKWVLRMSRAESQILVTHSHLTNFGWSGELHHDFHLVTLQIVIKHDKEVGQLTNKETLRNFTL